MSSESYSLTEVEQKELLHRQMQERFAREREAQRAQLREVLSVVEAARAASGEARRAAPAAAERKTTQLGGVVSHASDEVAESGFDASFLADGTKTPGEPAARPQGKLEAVDFSGLSGTHIPTEQEKKEAYAARISAQLSLMVPLRETDAEQKRRFTAYLAELLKDESLRFADFEQFLAPRWADLQSCMELLDPENDPTVEEYYTLCALLNERPEPLRKKQREAAIRKLRKRYEQQSQQEYVLRNLMEVFEELGMHVGEEMTLDSMTGRRVVDDEIPDCEIFMSLDGEGVLFETIAEVDADSADTMTTEQRATVEERAGKLCAKHEEVRRRMLARGIRMDVVSESKPRADRMKLRKRSTKKRRKADGGTSGVRVITD